MAYVVKLDVGRDVWYCGVRGGKLKVLNVKTRTPDDVPEGAFRFDTEESAREHIDKYILGVDPALRDKWAIRETRF